MNLVDCGNSDVYNNQVNIKIKEKNDSQSRMVETKNQTLSCP
jgi:hypothetical protein